MARSVREVVPYGELNVNGNSWPALACGLLRLVGAQLLHGEQVAVANAALPDLRLDAVMDHPLEVLRNWAALKRAALDGPVLAITGSNGKTVVKEWMYQLLGNANNVHRTPGSFNSEIGVPLTLSSLKTGHSSAIVEVGIDRPGVMVRHEDLAHPKFGVFTNLGDAHNEHFDQDDQKFEEKWQLFARCERVAMSKGWYDKAKTMGLTIPNPLLWGTGEALDPSDFPELPFSGGHHLENAMNAVAGAILLGATVDEIRSRISTLGSTPSLSRPG